MPVFASPAAFVSCIQDTFSLQLEGGAVRPLTLLSVDPHIDDEVQLCYALLFRSDGDVLPQHLYRVAHPALGEFNLFLVPIQQRKSGILYEAVFNLLKDEGQ